MAGVLDVDRTGLNVRVTPEVGAEEPAVPWPVVLRVGRGVNADEAAAPADETLESVLLVVVQDVPGGEQEDDAVVPGEARIRERGGVLRRVDDEPAALGDVSNGSHRDRDRQVPEAGGLREDEDARARPPLRRGRDGRAGQCL